MDTRTQILEAALGLLAKGGAQELTQPRIAKAAGVRQSHLTYYFPTVHDLLQGVALYTLDAITAEMRSHGPDERPASLLEAGHGTALDKRRMRMVLALATMTDREAKLKPPMREFFKTLRAGLAAMLKAGGLEGTPDQTAFLHSVVVGQGVMHLIRDNDEAREEARRVIGMAVEFLRRKG